MRSRAVSLTVLGTAILAGSAATSSASTDSGRALPKSIATALQVIQVPAPPLPVPEYRYRTTGTYPQVVGAPSAVNEGLTRAMLAHERDYVVDGIYRTYGRHYKGFEMSPSPGIFRANWSSFWSRTEFTSASTGVVSVMIPMLELYPGGNDGDVWMGATVRVPSGSPVYLRDILGRPKQAIPAIGDLARARLSHTDKGVHYRLTSKMDREFVVRSFAPRAKHAVRWALTPTGLALGYPVGAVSTVPSGWVETTIPYWRLSPYLTKPGRKLIADVRWPLGPNGEQLIPR
jgi:hypothetical protein